jgi:hypothetical protein
MTIEQLTLVGVGVLVNGLTFALGIAVGISLTRKDSTNGNEDKAKQWHRVERSRFEDRTGDGT